MDRIKDMMQRADFFLLTVGVITLARWTFADDSEDKIKDDECYRNKDNDYEENIIEVNRYKKNC